MEHPGMADNHHWYTPSEIAGLLEGTVSGAGFRARCPAHQGENPTSLSINEGTGRDGSPLTLLKCFAHGCYAEAVCEAMGIPLSGLWCIAPSKQRTLPGARQGHIRGMANMLRECGSPDADAIALLMLGEMLRDEPGFLAQCPPATALVERLWHDPLRRDMLRKLLTRHELELVLTGGTDGI